MALRDAVIFIFDLKSYVEKNKTDNRKPKKVSKQLNFFHFLFVIARCQVPVVPGANIFKIPVFDPQGQEVFT